MTLPKFLLQKKFMMESVLFVFASSVVYMLLYKPFSATVWLGFSTGRLALLTLLYYAIAIIVMVSSKFILILLQKRTYIGAAAYIVNIIIEYSFLSFLYVLFSAVFKITEVEVTARLVLKTLLCVSLILVIPYTFFVLLTAYRSLRDENRMLQALLAKNQEVPKDDLISLQDYSGAVKLSVDPDTIYYIESQDNYVKIYYENEGKLTSYMLRCRTQQMEEMLEGTEIHRCHRSYFVNFSKITQLNRSSNRATVTLSHPDAREIPVSKTYYRTVLGTNVTQNRLSRA